MSERTVSQIQAELDQHNRNVSWTCGRAGAEGTPLPKELMATLLEKSSKLQSELKVAIAQQPPRDAGREGKP